MFHVKRWMSVVGMMGLLWCASAMGCFDPMPVYASFEPVEATSAEASAAEVPQQRGEDRPEQQEALGEQQPAKPLLAEKTTPQEKEVVATPDVEASGDEEGREEEGEDPCAGKVELNTASEAELETLPRVGPAIAARIVAYRARRAFRRPSHIQRVKGIGPKTYQRMAEQICVAPLAAP